MAAFCTNCGAPVADQARFCPNCGATVAAAAQPPGASMPPPAGVPQRKSPVLKWVLIAGGVIVLLIVVTVAGLTYAAYRLRDRVVQDYGMGSTPAGAREARRVDVCTLLTAEEAAAIIGVPVERTEPSGDACTYVASPADSSGAAAEDQEQSGSTDASNAEEAREAMERAAKSASSEVAGAMHSFRIQVDWQGGRAAVNVMKMMARASGTQQPTASQIAELGDDAAFGPLDSVLVFAKGATSVQIELRAMPGAREKGLAIAKIVSGRLEF